MTPEDRKKFENSLDQVGRGDATPAEAALVVRDALSSGTPLADRVYAALRDVTWRTLTSRAFGDELQLWFDVFRHAAALASKNAPGGIAEKLRAYGDLFAQSARFAELQPLQEVLSRKHSEDVLRILALAGAPVKRAVLAKQLGLADSNLSRVVGTLSGRGLVERSASGKEANFVLTDTGRRTVERLGFATQARKKPDVAAWWDQVPFAVGVWDGRGNPIGSNPLFQSLAPLNLKSALPPLDEWRFEVSKLARDERMLADETWQLRIDEAKWVQYVERPTPEGYHVILGHDVSAHMLSVCDLEARVVAGAETEAKLRRELADAERRLVAYRSANTHIRSEMVDVAARSSESVRNSINALTHSSAPCFVPDELHQVKDRLRAMQLAMRHFMDAGDVFETDPRRLEVLDPRKVIGDAVRTAKVLNDPDIDVTYGHIERVRGALSPFRNLLGQLLMIGTKHDPNAGGYSLHADVKGSELFVTLKSKDPALHAVYLSPEKHSMDSGTIDTVASMGLGYCQVLAESYGGTFDVTAPPSDGIALVTLSFPIHKMQSNKVGRYGAARTMARHVRPKKIFVRPTEG